MHCVVGKDRQVHKHLPAFHTVNKWCFEKQVSTCDRHQSLLYHGLRCVLKINLMCVSILSLQDDQV